MAVPLAAAVALTCLTGCSSAAPSPGGHPLPTAMASSTPTPVPSAFSTAVPQQSAALPRDVAPTVAPARIAVAGLPIDQPVQPEGVDDTGAMSLPADPAIAGWWKFGPGPTSTTGTTVIAAHVDAVGYGIGPFAHLVDVPSGTVITLTGADGSTTRYQVQSVDLIRKTGVPWASIFDQDGPRRLVLVTCGGAFNTTTHHYDSNLVVTATPQ
ncbi:class F sortase [Curtobacterium sp. VKM Ac-2922]|uniref:class F sortase n=1 Tax=Curtobacterium sp. VKM Ac-2922 TaxID=2929475 RepID=UPI001FB4B999|nr:class F sortase [Curtobacterium sp. VKM Ac-2922]MCJ1714946.1 class F sortase [Curtobacterium sp. VKM Ac-2922]